MVNLNKIIYYLTVLLVVELMLFGIYLFVDTSFKTVEEDTPKSVMKLLTVSPINNLPPITKKTSKLVVKKEKRKSLEDVLVHVAPNSKSDIITINNQNVKPVIYTKSINLSALSIENKKRTFIDMLIPAILVAKYRISEERRRVAKLIQRKNISSKDALWLIKKRHIFKASTVDELYNKMELHPTSIVIAQAIIESGWGTSRFFEKANNVFGIWSFNKHEKRIAASEKRGKNTVYLKKYSSVEQSVFDYFLMLSTKDAYSDFREIRLESQDPFVLIEELGKYSELGDVYIKNLKNTIEKNELLAYDTYSLDI